MKYSVALLTLAATLGFAAPQGGIFNLCTRDHKCENPNEVCVWYSDITGARSGWVCVSDVIKTPATDGYPH
ncbi:hypothetical protein PT974_05624 [Cladobotryum mycophilum]|uniref:Extracellular membrane protein CFEM domain-containing protein n=1 Tax=Cladobotryum mycophilum TaxID=491253 RepID=A0ABR0SJB5_9HYPO